MVPEQGVAPLRRVGASDVERIEAATAAFRDWDYRCGGGVVLPAVAAQLRWVVRTGRTAVTASEEIRRRLLVATADLANLVAWVHYDVERHDEASRLWLTALDAAREAKQPSLTGSILWRMAHQALHRERPAEALGLLRLAAPTTAEPGNPAPDLAASRLAAYEAWCHAALGNADGRERAIGRAEEHYADVGRAAGAAPPWDRGFSRVELVALRGHTYHVLAAAAPHADQQTAAVLAAKAGPLLAEAVAGRGEGEVRTRVLNMIGLAASCFQRREGIEEGIALGHRALDGAAELSSPRTRSRLRALAAATGPYEGDADVAELRERLRVVSGVA